MHKRNFSLTTGACLNDDNYSIIAFDVRVDDADDISVLLPEPAELDAVIATSKWMIKRDTARTLDCGGSPPQSAIDAVPPPPYNTVEIVPPVPSKLGDGAGAGCVSMCGDAKLEW